MTRRPHVCPTCRRPFPPPLTVHGPVRQRVVNVIAGRPDGITRDEIMAAVYADDIDGGPDCPNVIPVLVRHANKELVPQGYQITVTWRGRGARYRLARIEQRNERGRH